MLILPLGECVQHNAFLDFCPGFRPKIVLAHIYRFPVPMTLTETVIQQITRPTKVVQKLLGSVFYPECYRQIKTFVFVWKTEFHSNNGQINDIVRFTIGSLFFSRFHDYVHDSVSADTKGLDVVY